MRLLHTSDWHLGRTFHRVGLLDAQAGYLDHLVQVVRSESVDVVIVAGDVYDRALPAVDVVAVLDEALAALTRAGATVVLCSGNHDSPRRLGFASRLLEASRLHVRTQPSRCGEPVLLADDAGPVAIYPLPYLEPALVADRLGCPPTHQASLTAAVTAVRGDLATRATGTRSVVVAHAFVGGGHPCESERDLTVGGTAQVPLSIFDGFDYVALGHLHGRQSLAPAVRYSGSPLAYSFSEHHQTKGSWLVELGPHGVERVDPVDAPVPRRLARIRGRLDDLLGDPALTCHEDAWCQVTLTDDRTPRAAMEQVRTRFPHALELRFDRPLRGTDADGGYTGRVRGRDDAAICRTFLDHVRGREADPAEAALLDEALAGVLLTGAEAAL